MTEESDLIALITVDGIERTYYMEGLPFTEFSVSVDTPVYQAENGEKFIDEETADKIKNVKASKVVKQIEECIQKIDSHR